MRVNDKELEAEDDDTISDVLEKAPNADVNDLPTVTRDGEPVILDADMDVTDLEEETNVGTLNSGTRMFG